MSADTTLSRRHVLKLALGATIALAVQSKWPAPALLRQAQQRLLVLQLSALLKHQESAKVIGAEYLRQYPQERDVAFLLNQVAASAAAGGAGLLGGTEQNRLQLLDRATREDFAFDRVVKLQGWILSVTEARICALAALA